MWIYIPKSVIIVRKDDVLLCQMMGNIKIMCSVLMQDAFKSIYKKQHTILCYDCLGNTCLTHLKSHQCRYE
ncbi:hypothetical protein KsCSTR_24850 [Candidatus Kuenenia stuttgartiensis]|uniref:Uncharacterized protein n=1 Tax=Kuenenia stuttgartiensis TaxID=174633 RepID=Q1Q420_KUEST|nr:hypothetical protein KsCSTR_24850 [Candidatus Kuenenia stuttgartiensis]CAJ74753.1 unknown protein [Candidatus Kuenenia stuttgartiensis]